MKVLICGGRTYADRGFVYNVLNAVKRKYPDLTIIQGGARGADALAEAWATAMKVPCETFIADWEHQGKRAGTIRNKRMLDVGQPDAVVAFPGGVGTAHMTKIAKAAGLTVWEPVKS